VAAGRLGTGAYDLSRSREKELSTMLKHRRLLLSLALSALFSLTGSGAGASPITMTIKLGGGASFLVDTVATSTPTSYTVDAAGLAAINSFLSTNGSEYRLFGLSGSSNFPGNVSQGNLVVTGEIHSIPTGGSDAVLTLTEAETSFTSPTGTGGTLMSSSSGNFTNQPAGGGHTALSMFNATSTPTYSVLSTGVAVNPGVNGGPVSAPVAPVSTLYTLTNVATFGLSKASGPSDIVDSFGVTATIGSIVPEPVSMVMFVTGMPLPLVVVGLLRRRRRAVA